MSRVSQGAERPGTDEWQSVCAIDQLEIGRGAAALVHGQAVAIFRVDDQTVFAVANHDPFSRQSTVARGIVGLRDDLWFVGSTVHRHAFDLVTGQCLEDAHVAIAVFEVKVVDGRVLVGHRKRAA